MISKTIPLRGFVKVSTNWVETNIIKEFDATKFEKEFPYAKILDYFAVYKLVNLISKNKSKLLELGTEIGVFFERLLDYLLPLRILHNFDYFFILKISGIFQCPIPKDQMDAFRHNLKNLFILRVEQERCKKGNDYVISPDKILDCRPSFEDDDPLLNLWNKYYKPKLDSEVRKSNYDLEKLVHLDNLFDKYFNSLVYYRFNEILGNYTDL